MSRSFEKILVTGGAGFIGSNFIRFVLNNRPDVKILNFDALTYAGNLESLRDIEDNPRYQFVRGDIADPKSVESLFEGAGFDAVVNFAAESHVDRSILDPGIFVKTNVMGTQVLLDHSRKNEVGRFLQVSTDEVYGSLGDEGAFTEETPLAPNSPYSASKTGADLLVRAAFHTFSQDVVTTRCSNNYGPFQFPEKLIPLMISNALADEGLPVYGDGLNVRDWLYVDDHCEAILVVLEKGTRGEVYNIGGNNERTNIDVVKTLLSTLGKGEDLIRFVKDRPGHDRRYAIDATRMRDELGWEPKFQFDEALAQTVQWYKDHQGWVERVRTGTYREYYERQYGERLT